VRNLSGGNQQKVVLAKTLATDSDVLIFDEPTRGIDVGAKQEIYALICELAEQGKGILMITSDMAELLGISDRIIVLAHGKVAGELSREEFSQVRVLELASVG
jgi:ribose transport system ATP-binding protein